jgi:hypothetical protein
MVLNAAYLTKVAILREEGCSSVSDKVSGCMTLNDFKRIVFVAGYSYGADALDSLTGLVGCTGSYLLRCRYRTWIFR